MSTSLSRQLDQLRTSSASAGSPLGSVFSSGPFLIDKSDFLDERQLELLAREAFSRLCEVGIYFSDFRKHLFDNEDGDGEEDEEAEEGKPSWQEDLLLLLTPVALTKPAQIVLQWLVSKHRVHNSYPEILIWSMMPHFQYKIFHCIVEAVAVLPSAKYPKWFAVFKASCFPATQTGLHRLVASDKGFFKLMCDWIMKTKDHHLRFRESSYESALFFFCNTLLNGLKNCSCFSENQVNGIMQVVICCLKSDHSEFFALGATLMAKTFPFISLKEKVANRVLKTLSKKVAKGTNENTLCLFLVLFRSQKSVLNNEKLMRSVALHEDIVSFTFGKADDLQFCMRLMANLIEMTKIVSQGMNPCESTVSVLQMAQQGLESFQLPVDAAQALVLNVSKSFLHFKSLRKTVKDDPEQKQLCKKILSKCKEILAQMKMKHPVEYLQYSQVQTEDIDIVVVSGDGNIVPTLEEINAKRILMDNELIRLTKSKILPLQRRSRDSTMKKTLKASSSSMSILFGGSVSYKFLMQQTDTEEIVNIVVNLVRLYDKKISVLRPLLKFLCSEDFAGNEKVQNILEENHVSLNLLILPLFWLNGEDQNASAMSEVEDSWLFDTEKGLLNSMLNAIMKKSKDNNKALWATFLKEADLNYLFDKCQLVTKGVALQTPDVMSLLLGALFSQSKCKPSHEQINVVTNLLGKICSDFETLSSNETAQKKRKGDLGDLVLLARIHKKIPQELLQKAMDFLANAKGSITEPLVCYVLALALAWKKKNVANLYEKIVKLHETLVGEGDNFEKQIVFTLSQSVATQPDGTETEVTNSMKIHCMKLLLTSYESNPNLIKRLLGGHSLLLSAILAATIGDNNKLKAVAFGILDQCCKTLANNTQILTPLVKFLADHKDQILSDAANLVAVMEDFVRQEKNAGNILKSILNLEIENYSSSSEKFANILPFVSTVTAKTEIVKLADFCLNLLDNDDELASRSTLGAVLSTFLPAFVQNRTSDSKCKKLVVSLLESNKKEMLYGNVKRPVAFVALHLMETKCDWDSEVTAPYDLFSLVVDLSSPSEESDILLEIRNVIQVMKGKPELFLKKLEEILGGPPHHQEVKGGRRRTNSNILSVQNEMKLSEEQERKIFFLLELIRADLLEDTGLLFLQNFFKVLKHLCDASSRGNAYHIDLTLSCILQVIESSSVEKLKSLNDKTINPELIVHCIKTCPNPNTKSTALLILAKASVCNAEYVLQNSIPIFTFMGNHFLKIDSRHSFDVACRAVDIIIPHIQQVCLPKGKSFLQDTNLDILITFVGASADMPTYRWKTFLKRVVSCLGEGEYLWILILMLIRPTHKDRKSLDENHKNPKSNERIEQTLDLFLEFGSKIQVGALLKIMVNMKEDSKMMRKLLKFKEQRSDSNPNEKEEFVLLQLVMLQFVKTALGSTIFSAQLLQSMKTDVDVSQRLHLLIECTISNLNNFEKVPSNFRYKKYLVRFSEKVFENSLRILPNETFLKILNSLFRSNKEGIRKKALEVLCNKLQNLNSFLETDKDAPVQLLDALMELALNVDEKEVVSSVDEKEVVSSREALDNQQLSLFCIRALSRKHASQWPGEFKAAAKKLTDKRHLKTLLNGDKIGSTCFCVTEILQNIGPHAVSLLPSFVNWVIGLMSQGKADIKSNPNLLQILILSVQKLMENFSGFLNPFYGDFVISACRLSSLQQDVKDQLFPRHGQSRMRHLQSAIANGIPTHSLLSITERCFDTVQDNAGALVALANILEENFKKLERVQVVSLTPQAMEVFLHVFKFRQQNSTKLSLESINGIEAAFIDAFMTITLKLSLDDFKPLFFRIFNLSFDHKRIDMALNTTVFHVTLAVAKRLKSLFEFVSESLINKSTTVLQKCREKNFASFKDLAEPETETFLSYVLDSLATIFHFNRVESLLTKNFEEHVNSLLAFYEFKFDDENLRQIFLEKMAGCLKQLAASTDDETQWKYLNYQVLMVLRSPSVEVRRCVLKLVEKFVEVKGENYMSVLPDAVPFLSEMMEDEEPEIEGDCKRLIQRMEEVFGQSVESYFE